RRGGFNRCAARACVHAVAASAPGHLDLSRGSLRRTRVARAARCGTRPASGMKGIELHRAPVRLVPGGLAIAAFAVGLTYTIKVSVIGEAALAELLLPVLGLAALSQRGAQGVLRDRAFLSLLGALLVTLAGYVASDLAAQSSAEQFLRGWGRTLLVLTDFVALALLIGAQRQTLWWFAFGMGLGRMLFLRLVMHEPLPMWKFAHDYTFGYAEPVTLVVIPLGFFLRPRTAALLLAGVGLYSISHDFRVQGAVCVVLAATLWMRAGRAAGRVSRAAATRLAITAGIVAIVLWGALRLTADSTAEQRREVSDTGRSFRKGFALKANGNLPLLGFGAWGKKTAILPLPRGARAGGGGADTGRSARTAR